MAAASTTAIGASAKTARRSRVRRLTSKACTRNRAANDHLTPISERDLVALPGSLGQRPSGRNAGCRRDRFRHCCLRLLFAHRQVLPLLWGRRRRVRVLAPAVRDAEREEDARPCDQQHRHYDECHHLNASRHHQQRYGRETELSLHPHLVMLLWVSRPDFVGRRRRCETRQGRGTHA